MKLFRWKEKVDERERAEMYRNEHYAFWFLFWALAVKVLVYRGILMAPLREYIWELAALLLVCLGLGICDLRYGHYSYHFTPGWRAYLMYSVGFALLFTGVMVAGGIYRQWIVTPREIAVVAAVEFLFMFALLYVLMIIVGAMTKWRRKKLEEKLLNEEND